MKYDQGIKREEIVTLEVCEKELALLVENDYQFRFENATEDEIITKRTPQEIIEEFNRGERNSWQTHNRRKVSFQTDEDDNQLTMLDLLIDDSQEKERQQQEDYEVLCQKIKQALKPEQAAMIIAICLDGVAVKDYATEIGDKPTNVYERFRYAKMILKKNL